MKHYMPITLSLYLFKKINSENICKYYLNLLFNPSNSHTEINKDDKLNT